MSRVTEIINKIDELAQKIQSLTDEEALELLDKWLVDVIQDEEFRSHAKRYIEKIDPQYRGLAAKFMVALMVSVHINHVIKEGLEGEKYFYSHALESLIWSLMSETRHEILKLYYKDVMRKFQEKGDKALAYFTAIFYTTIMQAEMHFGATRDALELLLYLVNIKEQ